MVQVGIDGVLKPVSVALIPGMPVIGVDLAPTSSGENSTPNNHNLMVMTRQQQCQQAAGRQKNQATAVTTASSSPLITAPI